ncbi:MAG: hypothetical protein AAGC46_00875 [Solirubrobacteraceae bacterium]|nr:hypothetical protein [Patulibacter sp.]
MTTTPTLGAARRAIGGTTSNNQPMRNDMACACVKAGKPKCAWCKEAEVHKIPLSKHNCSQGGSCS